MSEAEQKRLETVERTVRMIVDMDLPGLPEETREVLVQHFTGAMFVSTYVYDSPPPEAMDRIDSAEALLREVGESGVGFEDERVRWVEVQINRDVWEQIRTYARSGPPPEAMNDSQWQTGP